MPGFDLRQSKLSAYIGDQTFYRGALALMIPVALQQLVVALFSFVDSVMVSSINELAMSAVSVANKPTMIYHSLFFGITGAASILLSQYYGAGRLEVCQRVFSVEMLVGVLFSLVFSLVFYLFSEQIMGIFVKDPYTVTTGAQYIRVIAWSFLPTAVSSVCIFSLRSLGINFLPMLVSSLAIAANAALNYVLIFGKFGLPAMGVRGAALGTLFARGLEMCVYVSVLLSRRTPFSLRLGEARRIGAPLMRDYVQRAIPLTVNELFWSTGSTLFFWAYARVSEPALPAVNVADQVFNLAWVFALGMGNAVSVMVGKNLGAGDFGKARLHAKNLYGFALMISALCVAVGFAGTRYIGLIFQNLSPRQIPLARQLIVIYMCVIPTNALYVVSFFLLRAGGDTRNAMLLDSLYMWMLPVPAALAMGLLLRDRIDIRMAMAAVQFLMNLKVFWAMRIIKRGTWLANITRPVL